MKGFFKKIPKKYIVIIIMLLTLGVCTLFDVFYAKTYELSYAYEALYEVPTANQKNVITITVQLTQNGKPVSGHYLWMDNPVNYVEGVISSGGALRENQVETDGEGKAVFLYYPYNENKLLKPAGDVFLSVRDQNSSIFVEVYVKTDITIGLKPKGNEVGD